MKPEYILAILHTMDINDLSRWFNHFYDHYGTSTRCMFLPKEDVRRVFAQMVVDLGLDNAKRLWDESNDGEIIFYNYEDEEYEEFSTPKQMLKYTDVANFIPMLEGKTYAEVFGWMEKPSLEIRIEIRKRI